MSRYPLFDRRQIALEDLHQRGHDLTAADCKPLDAPRARYAHPEFPALVDHLVAGATRRRTVVLMIGGHAIKLGLSRYLVDLIERGLITHLATNGAGIIHDFELAAGGGTSENVSKWIERGQFGLWRETSRLNDIIFEAANRGEGLGEAVGRVIEEATTAVSPSEHRGGRLADGRAGHLARRHRQRHHPRACQLRRRRAGRGQLHRLLDLRPEHRRARRGRVSERRLGRHGPGGLSEGPVDGPQRGRASAASGLRDFTTAVFDLVELPANFRQGPPSKSHPQYYYRPWKTILVRTVADGGRSYFFSGDLSCDDSQPVERGGAAAIELDGHAARFRLCADNGCRGPVGCELALNSCRSQHRQQLSVPPDRNSVRNQS